MALRKHEPATPNLLYGAATRGGAWAVSRSRTGWDGSFVPLMKSCCSFAGVASVGGGITELGALGSEEPERRLALPILVRVRLEIPTDAALQTSDDLEFLAHTRDIIETWRREVIREGANNGSRWDYVFELLGTCLVIGRPVERRFRECI